VISFLWRTALLSRVNLIQEPRGLPFSQTFGQAPPTDRLTTRSLRKTRASGPWTVGTMRPNWS